MDSSSPGSAEKVTNALSVVVMSERGRSPPGSGPKRPNVTLQFRSWRKNDAAWAWVGKEIILTCLAAPCEPARRRIVSFDVWTPDRVGRRAALLLTFDRALVVAYRHHQVDAKRTSTTQERPEVGVRLWVFDQSVDSNRARWNDSVLHPSEGQSMVVLSPFPSKVKRSKIIHVGLVDSAMSGPNLLGTQIATQEQVQTPSSQLRIE
jgi:hypothetical protein